MKRKLLKKIVSLICIACMLGPLCIQGISASAENTDSVNEILTLDKELESTLKGFEYWTFKDVGIADDTYKSTKVVSRVMGTPLDGTIFHGKIAFISGSKDNNIGSYFIGGGGRYQGFLFQANGTSDLNFKFNGTGHAAELITTVTSAGAGGVSLRNNPELTISISVEYVNESNYTGDLEGYTDLKVGLFLNGKLYGNQYFEIIKVLKKDLGTFVSLEPDSASGASCTVASADLYDRTPSTELSNITLLDAGMSDGENKQLSGELDVDSLDDKLFSVWLTFNKSSRFYYALDKDTHTSCGIGFRLDESNPSQLIVGNETYNSSTVDKNGIGFINNMPFILATLDAQIAGVGDTFMGNQFLLQISTEFVDCHLDGRKNDIKLGIFFNGKLYGNEYFYISDNVAKLGKDIRFGNANMAFFGSYIPELDAELTEWSIRDAGMYDGKYFTDFAGLDTTETLTNTSFSTMVEFPTTGKSNLWIGDVNNGFVFQGQSGNQVYFAHMRDGKGTPVYQTTLKVQGVQLTGNKNLKFTFSVEAYKEKGMKIGIYLNDVLYQNSYIYLAYSPESLLRTVNVDNFGDTIWMKKVGDSETITPPENFEKITLLDGGVSDGENKQISGKLDVDSLNNKLFSVWLTFNKSSRFHYAVDNATHGFGGIGFRLNESDTSKLIIGNELAGTKYNTDAYPGVLNQMPAEWVTLDAETAGVGNEANGYNFAGNKFLLQISTEIFDGNNDGQKNDVRVGIYINGKLYENEYLYLLNSAEKLGKDINFNNANMAFFGSYTPETETELTEWSIRDAGLHDGIYSTNYDGIDTKETLTNTSFSTMVEFPTTGKLNLWIGDVNNGFVFQGQADDIVMFQAFSNGTHVRTLNLDAADVDLTGNKNLKLTLTVEDYKSKGMKIGIYFNDVLYNDSYVYLAYPADTLLRTLTIYRDADTIWLKNVGDSQPIAPPVDFEKVTLMDAGIMDGENKGFSGTLDVESLDRVLFSATLKYHKDFSRFHYGLAEHPYGGISFRLEGDRMIISNERANYGDMGYGFLSNMPFEFLELDAEIAGVGSSFADTEFLLQISTEFVDKDGDGRKNDIKLGIFFNGKLYSNIYFYIKDNAEHLGNGINFNEGAAARFASYQYQEDYEELTATDFGLEHATISGKTQVAKLDEETFDATAVNMMITFPKQAGGKFYLGGKSSGVCLTTNGDGSISVSHVGLDGMETALGVLEAEKAGVSSLTDKELEWRFAFHITPTSETNGYLQLGIYVNGTLYNGEEFTLADVELASLKRTIAIHSGKGKFEIAAITYDELTLHDFSIRDTIKETAPADTGWRIRNYRDYETLDGTAFSVIYNFTEGTLDRFSLGGSFWHGVIFMSGENDTIEVCYIDGNGRKNIVNLNADTAGVGALTGTDVKVRLTFDIICPDDKTNDLRLGIYINDKLYGGKHFTVEDVDLEALTRTCKLYIVEGPYKIESIKTSHKLSDYGFDENWRRTLGLAK